MSFDPYTRRFNYADVVRDGDVPEHYPASHIARTHRSATPGFAVTVGEATGLEMRYEILTRELKAGGPDSWEKANQLTDVESVLLQRYADIAHVLNPGGDAEEKAREMLAQTELLAKHRSRGNGRG